MSDRVDYVDLFLIHDPTKHGDLKKVWKEMEDLKHKGLTKSIGVSNFNAEHLSQILEAATVIPAVNQIEYHAHLVKASQPIIDLCKKHNIVIESYGGLSPITRVPGSPVVPIVESIRARLEQKTGGPVSGGQVLTKWLNQKGIVVVTTSSKEARLRETLQTLSLPILSPEDMDAIDEAGSKLHKRVFMTHAFKN
jgi:diketogulonate reductase-like aldo/keto reductase